MKVDIQTILNVCFAISITAFIYQNNSLKDDVETLKGYAQLDTDKAWERMDSIDLEIVELTESMDKVVSRIDDNLVYSLGLAEKIDLNTTNLTNLYDGVEDMTTKNFESLYEAIKFNEERIIANRKAMLDLANIMSR
ncbi:hypothetical protein N9D89_01620 [Gammaproteobacteria bacterium]|nr:hypothetical protein [Gammaproteobacteria bacterium]